MSVDVELQVVTEQKDVPAQSDFFRWVNAAAGERNAEIVVRLVDENESQTLNSTFRGKDKPTNVLSFPFEAPEQLQEINLLGDLVICAPVIAQEAEQQSKPLMSHWAHMAVHGTLHLLGYDHQNDEQAAEMEGLEKNILAGLGIANPYPDEVNV